MKKNLLIFLLILSNIIAIYYCDTKIDSKDINRTFVTIEINSIDYELVISELKRSEGYVETIYKCPAGYNTIGYGHLMTSKDTFKYLTKHQADSLLRVDLNNKIKSAYAITKIKESNKLLALGLLLFGIGEGNFIKSSLYKSIKTNDTIKIKNDWLKFININGKPNEQLRKRRIFELNLFL